MLSKRDWRTRLEFITTVFLKMEVKLTESVHFIVILVVVAAAAVLIEYSLTVPGPLGHLHLLNVLVTFQSNGLMSYAASGVWEEFSACMSFCF